jgi:hypothetical protein
MVRIGRIDADRSFAAPATAARTQKECIGVGATTLRPRCDRAFMRAPNTLGLLPPWISRPRGAIRAHPKGSRHPDSRGVRHRHGRRFWTSRGTAVSTLDAQRSTLLRPRPPRQLWPRRSRQLLPSGNSCAGALDRHGRVKSLLIKYLTVHNRRASARYAACLSTGQTERRLAFLSQLFALASRLSPCLRFSTRSWIVLAADVRWGSSSSGSSSPE